MNPWYVVGMVVGIGLILWGLLKNSESTRAKELHRLILQVSHEAGRTVLLHAQGSSAKEALDETSVKCLEALRTLDIEATIDGGEVKEAIGEFTQYVRFHVMRFLNFSGKINSDKETKQKFEFNEYQFIGSLPSKEKKAIQVIQKALK